MLMFRETIPVKRPLHEIAVSTDFCQFSKTLCKWKKSYINTETEHKETDTMNQVPFPNRNIFI